MSDSPPSSPSAAPSTPLSATAENTALESPAIENAVPASSGKQVGRAGLALSGAKLYFLLTGFAQQVIMTWVLKENYGALRGALSPASICYNPLVGAGIQGMSRVVSADPDEKVQPAIRKALSIHFALAALFAALFYFFAPILGAILNSEYLVTSFQCMAIVIFGYGMYAPLVGILNGRRRFLTQALLDTISATLRTIALAGGAYAGVKSGHGVLGATIGLGLLGIIMVIITLPLSGIGKSGSSNFSVKTHLNFLFPVLLSQALLNLLLQADTNTLRAFATRAAESKGLEATAADPLLGAYNAGQLFGFLPYQLLLGITFILFPLLSTAYANGDRQQIKLFVERGLRISVIVAGLAAAISAGIPSSLLSLAFPAQFAELGSGSLRILGIGLALFSVFGIQSTILNSIGKQWPALLVTAIALAAVVALNFIIVDGHPFGEELLLRTASATSLGILFATVLASWLIWLTTSALPVPKTFLRVILASAITALLGSFIGSHSKLLTILLSGAMALTYFTCLVLFKELSTDELKAVRKRLKR